MNNRTHFISPETTVPDSYYIFTADSLYVGLYLLISMQLRSWRKTDR